MPVTTKKRETRKQNEKITNMQLLQTKKKTHVEQHQTTKNYLRKMLLRTKRKREKRKKQLPQKSNTRTTIRNSKRRTMTTREPIHKCAKGKGPTNCEQCNKPFSLHSKGHMQRFNVIGLKVCVTCKRRWDKYGNFQYLKPRLPPDSKCYTCGGTTKMSKMRDHIYCSKCYSKALTACKVARRVYIKSLSVDELLALVRD